MNIFEATRENIIKAGNILKSGSLVVIPTETVYGLAGDVFNEKSLAKIFQVKERPHFDPLITHIADREILFKLADIEGNKLIEKVIDKFWPGPLTLVLPKKDIVPDLATSGLSTFAVRMPSNEIALEIIRHSNGALAAPSANPFGYLSPTTAEHVYSQLGDKVDMIIDGGLCQIGVESTVLDLSKSKPVVLRPGALSVEDLIAELGEVEVYNRKTVTPRAPGQLASHYSPGKDLIILDHNIVIDDHRKIGLLSFKGDKNGINYSTREILSTKGDIIEAAANLFKALHILDDSDVDVIYAEPVPECGIGRAIMDRLYKASKK